MNSETISYLIQVLRRGVYAEIAIAAFAGISLVLLYDFGVFVNPGAAKVIVFIFLMITTVLGVVFTMIFALVHDYLNTLLKKIIIEENKNAKRKRKN